MSEELNDPPPEHHSPRISVVRQLEDDGDDATAEPHTEAHDAPPAAAKKPTKAKPAGKVQRAQDEDDEAAAAANVQPSADEMSEMPGDEPDDAPAQDTPAAAQAEPAPEPAREPEEPAATPPTSEPAAEHTEEAAPAAAPAAKPAKGAKPAKPAVTTATNAKSEKAGGKSTAATAKPAAKAGKVAKPAATAPKEPAAASLPEPEPELAGAPADAAPPKAANAETAGKKPVGAGSEAATPSATAPAAPAGAQKVPAHAPVPEPEADAAPPKAAKAASGKKLVGAASKAAKPSAAAAAKDEPASAAASPPESEPASAAVSVPASPKAAAKPSKKPSASTAAKGGVSALAAKAEPATAVETEPQPEPESEPAPAPAPVAAEAPASPGPAQIHAIVPDSKPRKSAAPKSKAAAATTPADPEPTVPAAEEEPIAPPAAAAATKTKPAAAKPVVKAKKPSIAAAPAAEPVPPAREPTPPPPSEPASAAASPAPAKGKTLAASGSKAALKPAAKSTKSSATASSAPTPDQSSPDDSQQSSSLSGFDFEGAATVSKLTDQNRALKATLASRDAENAQMAEALLTLQEELSAAETNTGKDVSKDLARKLREASVLLTKERAKYEKQIETLKKEHAAALEAAGAKPEPVAKKSSTSAFGATGSATPTASAASNDPEALEARLKELSDKYNTAQKGYLERSTELTAAQKTNKALARALIKEIDSESVKSVDQVLDPEWLGKFKGRSQKITLLQSKVRELEKQLANANAGSRNGMRGLDEHEGGPNGSAASAASAATGSSAGSGVPLQNAVQDFHENTLHKMAADRRAEVSVLKGQLTAVTADCAEWKRKSEAAKARVTNLEAEVKQCKELAKGLFDKSAQDDAIIDSLRQLVEANGNVPLSSLKAASPTPGSRALSPAPPVPAAAALKRPPSGSGAAAAAAVRANYDSVRLVEQEKLIAQLREQMKKVEQRARDAQAKSGSGGANPALAASLAAYSSAEADTRVQLMQVEIDKHRERIALHSTRIADLEKTLMAAEKKNGELAAALAAAAPAAAAPAKAKATPAAAAGKTAPGSKASAASKDAAAASAAGAPSVATLQSQLSSALSETELIRRSYAQTLSNKDADIALLNDIINQKNAMYQKQIAELRAKMQEVTAASAKQ